MSRAKRVLLIASGLVLLVAGAFRVIGSASAPQTQLLNALVIAATTLLTGVVIWVVVSSVISSRGRRVTAALAALRSPNSTDVVFACQVEQGFWLALRRLKAELDDEGPGPWPAGAMRGNFVCAVVDPDLLTYWSVDATPVRLLSIDRNRITDIDTGSVPAGTTSLPGLILSITGTPPYTLTGVVEDESRPGYPAKLATIKHLVDTLHCTNR